MRYELARDSDVCAGGLRECAIRTRTLRCLAVTVALIMAFMLLPTRAYASGQVSEWSRVWFHSSVDNAEQYIVGAYNKFDAAAYICGYSKEQVTSWDLSVLNKLSTRNTAFLTLANSLQDVTPWNDDSLEDSFKEYFGESLWFGMGMIAVGSGGIGVNLNGVNSWQIKYWQMSKPTDMPVWAVNTTSADVGAAREAIQTILNSSDEPPSVDNVPTGYEILYGGSRSGDTFTVESKTPQYTSRLSFPVDVSANASMFADYPHYIVYMNEGYSTTPTGTANFYGYAVPNGVYIIRNISNNNYVYLWNSNGTSVQYKYITRSYKAIGDLYTVESRSVYNGTLNAGQLSLIMQGQAYYVATDTVGGGGGGGDDGPGDWPEDPSPEPPESPTVPTPTPPDLPTPYTPIIPPTVTVEPTTNVTDPTNWTDYTPWLQKILQQLRNINDEIAEHCVHIQQQIVDQATNIINELNAAIERLIDYLDELLRALTRYLEQLANWLADQLEYNDSSVLYWLRLIYQRLGKLIRTNVPTVLEPDPTEPFDFWAWLWGLITNVIGGFIGDFVGDVGDLIDAVKDKFPFSIPWDIAAMLALLDANRVTPVFVVNIPAVNGWWNAYSYRIDLQPFDSVAAACRAMFNIVWCFVLIMKTNWMLMIMGDSTSLGERFANRVGRGTE